MAYHTIYNIGSLCKPGHVADLMKLATRAWSGLRRHGLKIIQYERDCMSMNSETIQDNDLALRGACIYTVCVVLSVARGWFKFAL